MNTQPRFRAETDQVEVTRGPSVNFAGDPYRVFIPGMTLYYIDDVEVSQDEFTQRYNEWRSAQRVD